MRADYITADGTKGHMECPVIHPDQSEHNGGFTLFGFESYEDKDNGHLCEAITGLMSFKLTRSKVGF